MRVDFPAPLFPATTTMISLMASSCAATCSASGSSCVVSERLPALISDAINVGESEEKPSFSIFLTIDRGDWPLGSDGDRLPTGVVTSVLGRLCLCLCKGVSGSRSHDETSGEITWSY